MASLPHPKSHKCRRIIALALASLCPASAFATDIIGVQPASLDQPRINAAIRLLPNGDPLFADFFGQKAFNVQAFYDTGASGVLISKNTALSLGTMTTVGVPQATFNGQPVVFEDVGVAGSSSFHVSNNLSISVGNYHPDVDNAVFDAEDQFNNSNPTSFNNIDLSFYKHNFNNIRGQLGTFNTVEDPNLDDLDVFGMPLMKGKVVVMDPKPVDNILDTMRTYVYNPGTPFNAAAADSDPGIPVTTRSIKLSYGTFDQFTKVTPAGAAGPTLEHNPFVGPSPTNPADNTAPPIKLAYNNLTTNGSFLLDTGAAASIISNAKASALGLTVDESDPEHPVITGVPLAEQFTVTITGIGGSKVIPGFYLNSLLIRTQQGNAANDNDPKHLKFIDAPVLINDITVLNPTTNQSLTLDGILGMNLLVGTVFIDQGVGGLPIISDITPGAFDWVVFDEPSGLLKVRPRLAGDANRDGTVDFTDLVTLAQNYGNAPGDNYWSGADFNADGIVDFLDLVQTAQHYGMSDLADGDVIDLPHFELEFGQAVVPEPASLAILSLGALAMFNRRARRQ